MGVWEWKSPGGDPRHGILGLDTTRGDRLFITILGSAFIFLGWLALMGTPLWGGLGIFVAYGFAYSAGCRFNLSCYPKYLLIPAHDSHGPLVAMIWRSLIWVCFS